MRNCDANQPMTVIYIQRSFYHGYDHYSVDVIYVGDDHEYLNATWWLIYLSV